MEKKGVISMRQEESEPVQKAPDVDRTFEIYQRVFQNAPDSVVIVDYRERQPRIVRANPAFARFYGYGEGEVHGKNPNILKSGRNDPAVYIQMWRDLLDPEVGRWTGEIINRRKDGSFIEVILSISAIYGDSEVPDYFVATHVDVTQRNEDARQVKRSLAEMREMRDVMMSLLEDANEARGRLEKSLQELQEAQGRLIRAGKMAGIGQMAAGVAHEINNPLTSILGFAQLTLARTALDQEVRENLQMIEKEGRRCVGIIENLLNFARPVPADIRPLDLEEILEATLKLVRYTLEREKIEIEWVRRSGLPPVSGDAQRLQQVFLNLILNAQHAMPEGGRLTLTTDLLERDGRRYCGVSFADTGRGMTEEVQQKIFEPFFTTSYEEGRKGTGLGLAISHAIIEEHGGWIEVRSEPGRGSSFLVGLLISGQDRTGREGKGSHAW